MTFFKRCKPVLFSLVMAWPAFSQVQLFEQEASGIVPYLGFKYNQGIQEYLLGVEYTIDGRTTLGVNFSKPIADSLFDSDLKAYAFNPYAILEFIEPGSLGNFSFAARIDYIQENTFQKDDSTLTAADKYNGFKRTALGGGPIFALRIPKSDKLAIIPSLAYELFYVNSYKGDANNLADDGEKDVLWHDISVACALHFFLSETSGLNVEPKFSAKLGPGRSSDDLINAAINIGYIRNF